MLHGHWAHFPWANKSRVHLSDIICESSAVGESSFICYFDLKRRQIEVSRKLNKEALAFQWWSSNSPCVPRIRDYWGLWLSPLSLPMCSVFSLSSLLFSTSSPSSDVTRKESSRQSYMKFDFLGALVSFMHRKFKMNNWYYFYFYIWG